MRVRPKMEIALEFQECKDEFPVACRSREHLHVTATNEFLKGYNGDLVPYQIYDHAR